MLGQIADAGQRRLGAHRVIEHDAIDGGGADDRHHDFDEGRFARTVGAQEAEDFAAADLHVDAVEGLDGAFVDFGDVVEVDGKLA